MEPRHDKYPFFEANQVLSNLHLNQVFDYLDVQERLTRANLIGIGIVCGLEIRFNNPKEAPATIHISKGCGVTSEGFLIVEPEDVALVSYREYKLPSEFDYPQFKEGKSEEIKTQYSLWELFPAGEPDTIPLGTPTNFLSEKAVLLFYELKKESLRTCSPNDCNDKGSEVTGTVRRLLIQKTDLNQIIAVANLLPTKATTADLEQVLLAQLNLPNLRLPRYDVPNTNPVTTNQVFATFLAVFNLIKLAQTSGKILTAAYQAFKPVLQKTYPNDPFTDFMKKFGFLDTTPEDTGQVLFLQYYYDFFDDLLKAYEEFRYHGVELLCACSPPQGLFPRHLMLSLLTSDSTTTKPSIYRHPFIASPAMAGGACTQRLGELFQRLVEMTIRFTDNPSLPKQSGGAEIDEQIRLTPSILGTGPLSDKAIPYYYHQNGTPPLYHIWNYEKSRQYRANQNLSYRFDEYKDPSAPAFVSNPLSYDLEPHNFLRIEGHLGKDYKKVLKTLLSYKTLYRLPIEIMALRTGTFDEHISVDLSKETCRFQDLESLYDSFREGLLSTLCESVKYFYDIPIETSELKGGTPNLFLLTKYAPYYLYKAKTVGAWYEENLETIQSIPYVDLDQKDRPLSEQRLKKFFDWFKSIGLPSANLTPAGLIYYISKLTEDKVLPYSLSTLSLADLENKYQDLIMMILILRDKEINNKDLIGHLDRVLFSCKLEPIKAIHEEYTRRIRDLKQKQFLSFFLQKNPGIQHKAGVPLGGTFIIVYHDEQKPTLIDRVVDFDEIPEKIRTTPTFDTAKVDSAAIAGAFKRISGNRKFVDDPDIRFLLGTFSGKVPDLVPPPKAGDAADKIIRAAVNELADGTVIADFFLPYLCCSECAPVQFVLPVPPLGLEVQLGCTGANGTAEAALTTKGGMAPFTYQLDKQPFQALAGKLVLSAGPHTLVIRDSAGAESALQSLNVPTALTIGAETYTDDVSAQTYQVSFNISGGTAPYKSESGGTITGNTFTSASVKSGEKISVTIIDSVGCKVTKDFTHKVEDPCKLPCKGIALRCGYRFWIPEPDIEQKKIFTSYIAKPTKFVFEFPQENFVDISKDVEKIIQAKPDDLNKNFNDVIQSWLDQINELIAKKAQSSDWLRLDYSKDNKEPADSFGTLWIEHFECLGFQFHIRSEFKRPEVLESLDMVYTPNGTLIENLKTSIPGFNCIQINKCDPKRPIVDRCKEVDLMLKISKNPEQNNKYKLDVTPSGKDQPVAYLWEVQDGIPALSNNKQDTFIFELMKPTTKIIRLTAYTEKGCRVIVIDRIDLKPG